MDGKLVDSFHYGAAIAGLGITRLSDRPVLLLASPQGVEALEVGK